MCSCEAGTLIVLKEVACRESRYGSFLKCDMSIYTYEYCSNYFQVNVKEQLQAKGNQSAHSLQPDLYILPLLAGFDSDCKIRIFAE